MITRKQWAGLDTEAGGQVEDVQRSQSQGMHAVHDLRAFVHRHAIERNQTHHPTGDMLIELQLDFCPQGRRDEAGPLLRQQRAGHFTDQQLG